MGRSATTAVYVVAMAGAVVGLDVLFFRGHVWERMAANVGIVLGWGSSPKRIPVQPPTA
jgi:hypothetical protein